MILFSHGLNGYIDDLVSFPTPRIDAAVRHFVDLPPVCPSAKNTGPAQLSCIRKDPVFNMVDTMSGRAADMSRYPTVEFVLHAVAGWIEKFRTMNGLRDELGKCSPEEARQIAKDLGIAIEDLRRLVRKGPIAADALPKMLSALSVDARALEDADPAVMRDLQRTCVFCDHKNLCQRELAEGTAAQHFRQFCPNSHTFDALSKA